MNLSFVSAVLSGLIFVQNAHAFEIRRISDRDPSDVFAMRVRVASKDPDCFVYYTGFKYQNPNNTDIKLGTYIKKIWKTCGVFSNLSNKTHTLLSSSPTELYGDTIPDVSDDGTKVCYLTGFFGAIPSIAVVNTVTMTANYIGRSLINDKRKSRYCSMSPDGNSFAIESSIQLVPGATHAYNKYQIYATNDGGNNFVNPVGNDFPTVSFTGSYPQMSYDGRYIIFQSRQNGISELYFYTKDQNSERLTDFAENKCDLVAVYEGMKEYWGESNLTDVGITRALNSQCNTAVVLGWKVNGETAVSGNLLGAGHGTARIDNESRFITYTAGFAHANTGSSARILTAANLFLRDNHLGLIWQITNEGESGDPGLEKRIEDFCCPGGSASSQRGTCSKINEYRGMCCWQRTCWFPAQWPDISGDGSSIAFYSSFGPSATPKDYEIKHYHVKTGSTSVLTNTMDKDFDDVYPSISYKGDVVAFESKYDHQTPESNNGKLQVFAAKLDYGCSEYDMADNFSPNVTDVKEQCEFRDTTVDEPFTFSGYGVQIGFDFIKQDLMNNIPSGMKSQKRRDNTEKFCNTFVESLLDDLSFAMRLPVTFFKVSKKCMRRCRNNPNRSLSFKIAFLTNDIDLYTPRTQDLKLLVSEGPSYWHKYLKEILSSERAVRNYLLKEFSSLKNLKTLKEKRY